MTRVLLFYFLFFMRLSISHYLGYRFGELNHIDLDRFFFSYFFFNFIIQHWVDWKIGFIICFNFISMRLSQSRDPKYKFGKLTQVDSSCCFFLIFF
jgi:hypothetical protein